MFVDRMRTLHKAYASADKNNKVYQQALEQQSLEKAQLEFLQGMHEQLKLFDLAVTQKESEWREGVLSVLENEIIRDLTHVFPTDGYTVKLSTRVLRGKIHIEARVCSVASGDIPGRISSTQGRFFQQVVSSSALLGVMLLLGISTVYIDEAFSGASKSNVRKLIGLISSLKERGINLIMIAQDTSMADGLECNRLLLQRSLDNQTTVTQEVGV